MKYFFRKGLGNVLKPHGDEALEMVKKLPLNQAVEVSVSRPRNHAQHRYYWELCRLVAENHDVLDDAELVHQYLKIRSGHVELVRVGDNIVKVPKSIAFDKMEQEEFDKYLSRAKDVVVQELLPNVGLRELQEEILRMVG